MPLTATIAISTRNRRDELRRALRSALAQQPGFDVLVIDDGSTDGTAEMVRSEFPGVRFERADESLGYIAQRNRAARLSSADVVVSIDDDAVFSENDLVARTLAEFSDARIGAVAIPFVNVNTSADVLQRAPDDARCWITGSFTGTAYAVRRELFLDLGGFREVLVHQGEEGDFCIRMLDAGYFVRLGSSAPILHYESPRRDRRRMDYYGPRNLILYAWQNVPFLSLPVHLAMTTAKALMHGVQWHRLKGIAAGYRMFGRSGAGRSPVRRATYRLSRRLKTRGPIDLERIVGGR
jgi:GT2 family glycosyltransferase